MANNIIGKRIAGLLREQGKKNRVSLQNRPALRERPYPGISKAIKDAKKGKTSESDEEDK